MAAKYLIVFCASTCFVQIIAAQCIGAMNSIAATTLAADELALAANRASLGAYGPASLGYAAAGYGTPASYGFNPTSSGGGFAVTSTSPISPTGITVVSENAIEGPLAITGQLPFLGAIALEGALPSSGAGTINYGCGGGAVGIVSEGVAPAMAPAMAPAAYPAGYDRLGFGAASMAGGLSYPNMAGPRPCNHGIGAGLSYGPAY